MRMRGNLMDVAKAIRRDLRKEVLRHERATKAAAKEASDGLKDDLRRQLKAAGLGERLSKTWRSKAYPEKGGSLDAAGVVWSNAPHIISAHSDGSVIRASSRRFLAIPTDFAKDLTLFDSRSASGAFGKATTGRAKRRTLTPRNFEKATGIKLFKLDRPGKNPLLIARGVNVSKGKQRRVRAATVRKATKTMGARVNLRGLASVPMFILVPQVRLKKRLNPGDPARVWSARMPRLIERNMSNANKG